MDIIQNNEDAKRLLQRGGILAYPTEAVFGLGCDPFNAVAIEKIMSLKGRGADKGFIILISNWHQLIPLINPITDEQLASVRSTWPGFTTWIFPVSPTLPRWITGGKSTIAIRMTDHPIAKALCTDFPIISTSANRSGEPPIRDQTTLQLEFSLEVDALMQGELGPYSTPSTIIDVLTNLRVR